MRRLLKNLIVVLAGFYSCSVPIPASALDEAGAQRIVESAVDGYILPSLEDFRQEAVRLNSDTARFCQTRTAEAFDRLRLQFKPLAESYARISFLTFGPLLDENRFERLAYWPDRKGIGLRQVQKILADGDKTVISVASLQNKSVAVQGLLALEFLLFGSPSEQLLAGPDEQTDFLCGYAQAISSNIQDISRALSDDWNGPDGFAALLKAPSEQNAAYRNEKEAAAEILAALATGTQTVRRRMVDDVIGSEPGRAKPKRALFWRSGNALPVLTARSDGLHDYYRALNLADFLGEETAWIDGSVNFEFRNAKRAIGSLSPDGYLRLKDPGIHAKFVYLGIVLDGLNDLVAGHIFDALSLTAGFNALDGD